MGSPLSGVVAESFIQYLEQQVLKHAIESKTIIYYTRYVDNIFIIYDQCEITPELILEHFNKQHKAIEITITEENNKQISYLDLNISNKQGAIYIDIYRKPMTTDITLHATLANKKWLHRLHKLLLNDTSKTKELNAIINIAENNGYSRQHIIRLDNRIKQNKKYHQESKDTTQKLVSFTYSGSYIGKSQSF
jgi:hypothetical protein